MQKLKVLLINPPIKPQNPPYNIPLGLACIAAVIDSKGHDVAIFDNNAYRLGFDEIIGQIKTVQWDMICLGNLVTTYPWQKAMIKKLRKTFPGAVIQVGGGLATSLQQDLMEWIPEIDLLIVGEGERTIGEVLENFENRSWENVRGILYPEKGEDFPDLSPTPLVRGRIDHIAISKTRSSSFGGSLFQTQWYSPES